jgi:hypothetical protein
MQQALVQQELLIKDLLEVLVAAQVTHRAVVVVAQVQWVLPELLRAAMVVTVLHPQSLAHLSQGQVVVVAVNIIQEPLALVVQVAEEMD